MEKQLAEELMHDILQLSAQLNVIAAKVEALAPPAELAVLRRHMASMMAACDEHLFSPVLRQYPELEPHC